MYLMEIKYLMIIKKIRRIAFNNIFFPFTQEILVFQQDRSADVRRFVVGFIEEAW